MFLIPAHLVDSERPALFDNGVSWSYASLAKAVQATAAESFAAPRKSLAFLFCNNDVATVIAYLAGIEAGHAVALFDNALAPEFREHLVELYQPDFLVTTIAGAPAPAVARLERSADAAPLHPDLSLLLSTSGSTGSPKLVRLTRASVEANARSIAEALHINENERAVTSLPLHYSYGLSVLNSHLYSGAEVVCSNEGLMATTFWTLFRDRQCTSWAGVPYSYQILNRLNLDRLNVPSLRTLTQAGGKLHVDLISKFHQLMRARGGRFFVMYGQTEATARIAILPDECLPEKLGSAGKAIPRGELLIEGPDGITAQPGVSGEVIYRGPNVMMGYAQSRDDLQRGDEIGGLLHTGDVGHLDGNGCIFLTGRRKRDAKVFGLRMNMDEIEEMLRHYGPTAVITQREKLVIFCEHGGTDQFSTYARELSSKLKVHIGAFEFHRIDELPINANGKIDYSKLEELP